MGHCLFMRKGETHTAPISGILASDLAVGSSVYLMEDGVATEYLVVNQGKPSGSSLYDDSCDGTWLLRKDIKEERQWHSSDVNDYANSTIHTWLNGDFFNLFGSIEQSTIKQVKIPYRSGSGYGTSITIGASGLSTKILLLSGTEVNVINYTTAPSNEGAVLSYFEGDDATSHNKRIAYYSGNASQWYLRSPGCYSPRGSTIALKITTEGSCGVSLCSSVLGIRPALVIQSNAMFDKTTMLLKGVA